MLYVFVFISARYGSCSGDQRFNEAEEAVIDIQQH